MGVFDDLMKEHIQEPSREGFLWINILVKFDTQGNATIIRSFTKQAKDSFIKKLEKPKEENPSLNIEIKEGKESTNLF